MKVRILLITHESIGNELLKVTRNTYGTHDLPIETHVIGVDYKTTPENLIPELQKLVKELEANDGLLILTDLYGSTPCNIALTLERYQNVQIISGLNLPMLLKVMNYPALDLTHLAQKALCGGKEGVINCTREHT